MKLYTHKSKPASLALVFAIALSLLLAFTVPSSAGPGSEIFEANNPNPDRTLINKDPNNPNPDLEFFCDDRTDARVRKNYGVVINGPAPSCVGEPGLSSYFRLCQPALQVFRFYGNVKDPLIGWSTSMAAQEQWCAAERTYLWSTSGYDTKTDELTYSNADKRSSGPKAIPDLGQKPDPKGTYNQRGQNLGPMYASQWVLPGLDGQGGMPKYITSGRPFDGNDKCMDAQTTNPFVEVLNDPEVPDQAKKDTIRVLQQMVKSAEKDLIRRLELDGNNSSHVAAAQSLARKYTGILEADAQNMTARFVDENCASPAQYISTVDFDKYPARKLEDYPGQQQKFPVTGVCYIPIEAMARDMTDNNGRRVWAWPSIKHQAYGGGLRYSDYYTQMKMPYTASNFKRQFSNQELPSSLERRILNTWRDKMKDWYMDNSGADVPSLMNNVMHQWIPANPYPVTDYRSRLVNDKALTGNMYNQAAAANTLRDSSQCRFGPRLHRFNSVPNEEIVDPVGELTLKNQAVQQADGYSDSEYQFTVTDHGITCDGSVCDGYSIEFVDLTYSLNIKAPADWNLAASNKADQGDYDAHFWTEGSGASGAMTCSANTCTVNVNASAQGSTFTVHSRYFKPTRPNETVDVTLSGPTAKFRQKKDYTRIYWYTDPDTKELVSDSYTETVSEEKTTSDFSVDVGPTPATTGGSSWTYAMKVISAIATN